MTPFTLAEPYNTATQARIALIDWEQREVHYRLLDATGTELPGLYVVGPIAPETELSEATAPELIQTALTGAGDGPES